SIWSAVNIAKYQALQAQDRIAPAGAQAFAQRKDEKSVIYAYEQAHTAVLSGQEQAAFGRDAAAWAYFEACPAGYRKVLLHWVTTAKKPETRAARLAKLVEACRAGVRLR
ncbi:MAG: YdeI/OmpD-associated family protein, partial [Burkholderiaceae bacterium]